MATTYGPGVRTTHLRILCQPERLRTSPAAHWCVELDAGRAQLVVETGHLKIVAIQSRHFVEQLARHSVW